MLYRAFGKTDLKTSSLGFGLMRLPRTSEDPADIDEDESMRMVHHAIDNGINYVDTAYGYHGGNSERFAARALKGGYREKVTLATKLPTYLVEEEADFEKFLNEQLEKLETDHIDVYLLHALNARRWEKVNSLGVTEFLSRAIKDGRIGCAGFSFHDQLDVYKEIVDAYDWTMSLIQLNYMDHRYQAGVAGLKYAADRGLAVAIMEPLRGGNLALNVPDEVREIWASSGVEWSPAEWALRWLWNLPEVSVVLSGMSTLDQIKENIGAAGAARPGCLTPDQIALVDRVREFYEERTRVSCTDCEYCMPCPQGVEIPMMFGLYNKGAMYGDWNAARRSYSRLLQGEKGAPTCEECGQCESACPQDIAIPQVLKEAHKTLAEAPGTPS